MTIAKPDQIISDAEVAAVHFGRWPEGVDKRGIIAEGVAKTAFGYDTGSTVRAILLKHKLISRHPRPNLTIKGKQYLRSSFPDGLDRLLAIEFCLDGSS